MINIQNKIECCGCQACGDICGKKAISFQTDEEGIWYPVIDKEKCVDCGLCEKVCPIINRANKSNNSNNPLTYIIQSPNPIDRLNSASGGAYSLIVREVFKKGGYVAGHIWDGKSSVKGFISCNLSDLPMLQSTKYLQSNVEGIYKAVKGLLEQGKLVLFSGCPCQNAAMRSYLSKDYDNLVMTDFTCMGIDSPWAFKKYIESLETRYNSKIVFFKAKSKEVGWRYLTNKAIFENGRSYFGIYGKDANLKATFLNVLVRPSCYDCKFKGFPRVSDITIGDYWRVNYDEDPLDDNTGTSYVMLHNSKAEKLFVPILQECLYRKIEYSEVLGANPLAMTSLSKPSFEREVFYERLQNEDFSSLVDEYCGKPMTQNSLLRKLLKLIKFIVIAAYYNRKTPISYIRMLHYNLFSSKVKANIFNGDVLILRNTKLTIGKNAKIEVKGHCIFDAKDKKTIVLLGDDASMIIDNNLIKSGCLINIKHNASLQVKYKTIISEDVCLYASSNIKIGEFCLIDKNVNIDDTDNGVICFDGTRYDDKTINIGTHALIGRNTIINGGTFIGDESIVREFSSIKGIYPPHITLSGSPATIINKNINWKLNFDFIWNYKN